MNCSMLGLTPISPVYLDFISLKMEKAKSLEKMRTPSRVAKMVFVATIVLALMSVTLMLVVRFLFVGTAFIGTGWPEAKETENAPSAWAPRKAEGSNGRGDPGGNSDQCLSSKIFNEKRLWIDIFFRW